MCNCKKAETLVERYGESVASKSDAFIFFSKVVDTVFVCSVMAVMFPAIFFYWLVMNVIGKRPSIRLPRKMAESINLAMQKNGEAIQN